VGRLLPTHFLHVLDVFSYFFHRPAITLIILGLLRRIVPSHFHFPLHRRRDRWVHPPANARLALVAIARTILTIKAGIKTASSERTPCLATIVEERLKNPRPFLTLAGMPLGESSTVNARFCVLPAGNDRLQADLLIFSPILDTTSAFPATPATPAFRGFRGFRGFRPQDKMSFGVTDA